MSVPLPEDCHYEVTVTVEKPTDEKDRFVTLEAAKAFAEDQLQKDHVVKCTIKKVEPKEDDSDGERVQE